jgi:phage baseplate assembly protein V
VSATRDTAELERSRANLVQIGTVAEADYATARVRVKLGELVTAWLPWNSVRAGGDRTWSAPEVGEQVSVLCPDGDPAGGIVLGAIYCNDHAAPANAATVARTTYADGAVIEYDRAAHRLSAVLPSGATVNLVADGGMTINAEGGVTINASGGNILVQGDVIADGVSLKTHRHTNVEPGSGKSGPPE